MGSFDLWSVISGCVFFALAAVKANREMGCSRASIAKSAQTCLLPTGQNAAIAAYFAVIRCARIVGRPERRQLAGSDVCKVIRMTLAIVLRSIDQAGSRNLC